MKNTIAISTWSIHRALGTSFVNGPGMPEPFLKQETWGKGMMDILDVPSALAARGYRACEICHFHVASHGAEYLARLRQAFEAAGVTIQTLLIDDGDISDKTTCQTDLAWIRTWINTASKLGAHHARVIAGKQKPSPETLRLSVEALRELVAYGKAQGVKVATENWLDLTATPKEVHHILDHVPGLAFMTDTGNWEGPTKYKDLASIFARSQLCHAKATLAAGYVVDQTDFQQCLASAKASGYTGPMTLIFHDDGDEWLGLEAERSMVLTA
jgi:sugar phosphate isomerase/epimerase